MARSPQRSQQRRNTPQLVCSFVARFACVRSLPRVSRFCLFLNESECDIGSHLFKCSIARRAISPAGFANHFQSHLSDERRDTRFTHRTDRPVRNWRRWRRTREVGITEIIVRLIRELKKRAIIVRDVKLLFIRLLLNRRIAGVRLHCMQLHLNNRGLLQILRWGLVYQQKNGGRRVFEI